MEMEGLEERCGMQTSVPVNASYPQEGSQEGREDVCV
jgi:hypothetical protein